jgi:hypothetical protein
VLQQLEQALQQQQAVVAAEEAVALPHLIKLLLDKN